MKIMVLSIFTSIFLVISPLFAAEFYMLSSDELLKQKCSEMNGEIVTEWTCPSSGDQRKALHCRVLDNESRPMFFNGCSGSVGIYGEIFIQACIYHDFCYHHEPLTSGMKREDCDSKFYYDMFEICAKRPKDKNCQDAARWFYNAVDTFGKTAWTCSKEIANYPRGPVVFQELLSFKW